MHSVCILAYCLMQSACGNLVVFAFYHRLTTGFPGGVQAAPCRPHHPGVVNDLQRTTGFPIRTGRCARHPIRRGRCPHRPVFQCNNHMDVIRHDDIFINECILMFCIDIVDVLLGDCPNFTQKNRRGDTHITPYDASQGFAPMEGTYCHKEISRLRVIVPFQTHLFSIWHVTISIIHMLVPL